MLITRTLASPARRAVHGGIGNETPWGVEADELFSRPTKKRTAPRADTATTIPAREEPEPVEPEGELPVSITD